MITRIARKGELVKTQRYVHYFRQLSLDISTTSIKTISKRLKHKQSNKLTGLALVRSFFFFLFVPVPFDELPPVLPLPPLLFGAPN